MTNCSVEEVQEEQKSSPANSNEGKSKETDMYITQPSQSRQQQGIISGKKPREGGLVIYKALDRSNTVSFTGQIFNLGSQIVKKKK